jgi:hypothetical protein
VLPPRILVNYFTDFYHVLDSLLSKFIAWNARLVSGFSRSAGGSGRSQVLPLKFGVKKMAERSIRIRPDDFEALYRVRSSLCHMLESGQLRSSRPPISTRLDYYFRSQAKPLEHRCIAEVVMQKRKPRKPILLSADQHRSARSHTHLPLVVVVRKFSATTTTCAFPKPLFFPCICLRILFQS